MNDFLLTVASSIVLLAAIYGFNLSWTPPTARVDVSSRVEIPLFRPCTMDTGLKFALISKSAVLFHAKIITLTYTNFIWKLSDCPLTGGGFHFVENQVVLD